MIRHGQTDWNLVGRIQGRTEVPLNAAGIAQAHAVAEHVAAPLAGPDAPVVWGEVQWGTVLTSPLSRARDTATIIAARLQLEPPVAHTGLLERDFGVAEGLAGAELVAARAGGEYPGSEPRKDVALRAAAVLEAMHAEAPGSAAIVVSHGACLRLLLGHLLGHKIEPLDNATLTVLQRDDSGWSLCTFNEPPRARPSS
mgnify:FL=1